MALTKKSLFLYGIQVVAGHTAIDFKAAVGGPELQATLRTGFYSMAGLLAEVARALNEADPDNFYSATATRTYSSNTQNRITITSNGAFFRLLFLTGSRTATNASSAIGFNVADYTGAVTYTGSTSVGTALIPERVGYNYSFQQNNRKQEGVVTVAASGEKDAVVFSTQRFVDVKFMYEPEAKVISEWLPFWSWATDIKPFDFVPNYETAPSDVYSVTLEKTDFAGNGMGWKMGEQLPSFPFMYQTGLMTMRLTPSGN